jgi:hypothetical protein
MYCGVNNLTPPHLWLHMFYFLNNITVKIAILSIQSSSNVTKKRKWLDALCPPFPLNYQLVIFSPLSIMVTCQYHTGFPTSTLSYLPSSCVVQYWCSKHFKEMYCLSNSFLIEWRMSHTLKGWIWSSDMVLLVYVVDELKECTPRGYQEHTLHHTPFMCTVQRPWRTVTLDAMRTTCNLEYDEVYLVTDDLSDWLYHANESQGCLAHVMWTGTPCHPQRICNEASRFSSWVQFSQWYLH